MRTLTQRALEIATRKRDEAWERRNRATNVNARRFWEVRNNQLSVSIIKLKYRLAND